MEAMLNQSLYIYMPFTTKETQLDTKEIIIKPWLWYDPQLNSFLMK